MSSRVAKPSSKAEASAIAQAVAAAPKAALPAKLSPQLATLAAAPPRAGAWVYEIKFDGYRILARLEGGRVRLFTRNGHDWTAKMQSLAAEVGKLGIQNAWLDGEAVVMGANGLPSFNALQNAFDHGGTEGIILYAFDVPFLDGKDLRSVPLGTRRAILQACMAASASDRVRFSDAFGADGVSVLQSACKMGLEGVIAKRLDSRYELRRSETWLKLKCHRRQEFVVGGFTDRAGGRKEVGSLLLGVYDHEGRLRSAGSVGTGWSAADGAALMKRLARLETKTSPFDAQHAPSKGRWSKRASGSERWVKPITVAEVSFAEWTPEGNVRHDSFEGLRTDKPATSIRRENAVSVGSPATRATSFHRKPASSTKVSNADRVIDASTGLKKIDLVRYYETVAEWILPHLKGRPTSLVRGPDGVGGELFFQKHGDKIGIPGIRELDPSLWPGHQGLLEIPSAEALVGAAQLNVIEFHTWNASTKRINTPDRMIFDLDPGQGIAWPQVQEAATLMRVLLTELGLASWLKTSGGKGLHVVVPLAAQLDYDTVNEFSKAVVMHLARTIPSRFVAKSGGGNRTGKIFVDYLRNGQGATTASAFSARARPGLGVSITIDWEQLPEVKSGSQWSITTARDYLLLRREDPWAAYWANKQTLKRPMKILGFPPPTPRK
jgi:bifunctional non-homologous end joining protein LigD